MSSFRIFLDSALTGDRLATVQLEPNSTVEQLRSSAHAATSLKCPQLIFGPALLNNDALDLAACGLSEGSVVQVADMPCVRVTLKGTASFEECDRRCCDEISFEASFQPGDADHLEMLAGKAAHDIKEFSNKEFLDIIENNYTLEGKFCACNDASKAGSIIALVRADEPISGFSGNWTSSSHRADRWYEEHVFLVAGHILSLKRHEMVC